jgi:hypothetical protein
LDEKADVPVQGRGKDQLTGGTRYGDDLAAQQHRPTCGSMQKFLIKTINGGLLVIILIGIPAVTRSHFGSWDVSSVPLAQKLTFGGLALAIMINVLGATIFVPGPKAKALCAEWAFVFGGLLFLEYAFVRGWVNFNWLKSSLLWVQKHF